MDFKNYLNEKLDNLELVLRELSIPLNVDEAGLKLVEKELSCKLEKGELNNSFFRKFQLNFLYLIGEVFIRTYGGKWIISEKQMMENKYPSGIECGNGVVTKGFVGYFLDLFHEEEEIQYLKEYKITSPYYNIKIECEEKEL